MEDPFLVSQRLTDLASSGFAPRASDMALLHTQAKIDAAFRGIVGPAIGSAFEQLKTGTPISAFDNGSLAAHEKIAAAMRGLVAPPGLGPLSLDSSSVTGRDALAELMRNDAAFRTGIVAKAAIGGIEAERFAAATKLNALATATIDPATLRALGIGASSVGEIARSGHWASSVGGLGQSEITKLLGASDSVSRQFVALQRSLAAAGADLRLGAAFRAVRELSGLSGTSAKLSLYAGAMDVFGPAASSSHAAFDSLLGTYRSYTEPFDQFARKRSERARAYREAEVDEGLIDADTAATIEVMVESGLSEGGLTRAGNLVALVNIGSSTMRVTASRARTSTFELIEAAEAELRACVASSLMAAVRQSMGEAQAANWFKHRVPGDVVKKSKERRQAARLANEPHRPLIEFVELGDLISIITRRDNWQDAFEPIFEKMEHLKVDLERLIAIRRPIMHGRAIDGVQVTEAFLVVRRLQSWMQMLGARDEGWDDDL